MIVKTREQVTNETSNREETRWTISKSANRKLTSLLHKIVAGLIVCYIPYLAFDHYYYAVIVHREDSKILDSEVIKNNQPSKNISLFK